MSLPSRTDFDADEFSVSFNQDPSEYRSLAVGSKDGYSLFKLDTVDSNLKRIYHRRGEAICILEHLFNTSVVAIVSWKNQRKLMLWNFKKQEEISSYHYTDTILAVRMNRFRLVVCCKEKLFISNFATLEVAHSVDTPPNTAGICALAFDWSHIHLAYPDSATAGVVQIYDAAEFQAKRKITAHESPLAALAFNPMGTQVATTSEKGTVIRVFSVIDGSKLSEYRRGIPRVSIASLAFSSCSQYLCCSSNTETVHIFKLGYTSPVHNDDQGSKDNWMSYIFQQVTDVLTQKRSFATAVLPVVGPKTSCIMTTIQKSLRLLVASQLGQLFVYQLPEEGVQCQHLKTHDIGIMEPAITTQLESLAISVPDASSPGSSGASNAVAHKNGAISSVAPSNISGQPSSSSVSEHDFEIINPTLL